MSIQRKRLYRREPAQNKHMSQKSSLRGNLAIANGYFDAGKYLQAARMYEQLGLEAMVGGLIQRSPFLYLQASRAYFLARHAEAGNRLLRYGINLLAEAGRWAAARRIGQVYAGQVRALGYFRTADDFLTWLDRLLSGHTSFGCSHHFDAASSGQKQDYPAEYLTASCPHCGASFSTTFDQGGADSQAICPYCGKTFTE